MPLNHPLDLRGDRFRGIAGTGNVNLQRDVA